MSKHKKKLPKVKSVKPAPVVKAEKPSLEARVIELEGDLVRLGKALIAQFGLGPMADEINRIVSEKQDR